VRQNMQDSGEQKKARTPDGTFKPDGNLVVSVRPLSFR
jgi:hypothetical protein